MKRELFSPKTRRAAFTLVELLVVITIIGLLAAITVPVIRGALVRARDTAMRMEIENIERGVNAYATKYNGDLPPDGSSWLVLNRHLNKAFPRISNIDRCLLYNMCHTPRVTSATANPSGGVLDPTAINRSEAIVLFLGGLSDDETRPFTGPGGPLQIVPGASPVSGVPAPLAPENYQYNIERNNAMVDFDVARLTLAQLPNPTAPVSAANRVISSDGDGDVLPEYLPDGRETPFVYFERRTYGFIADPLPSGVQPYNGYIATNGSAIRPYKTALNPPGGSGGYTAATVPEALRWQNADSFQIICAGQDDHFGNLAFNPSEPSMPAYFLTETGQLMACDVSAGSGPDMLFPGISKFQERTINPTAENTHLDNLTNFSSGGQIRLEDGLEE